MSSEHTRFNLCSKLNEKIITKSINANIIILFVCPFHISLALIFSKLIRIAVAASVLVQIQKCFLLIAPQIKANELLRSLQLFDDLVAQTAAAVISFFRDYDFELLRNAVAVGVVRTFISHHKKRFDTRCIHCHHH